MSDRVRRLALYWASATTAPFWLVTVRGAFDGASYQWGLFGFGGQGLTGDYWFPLTCSAVSLVVLIAGWQGRRWAFAALILWNLLLFAAVVFVVRSSAQELRFRGDTLGIDVSLAVVGPLLFGAGTLLSLVAAVRAFRASANIGLLARPDRRWLIAPASVLPIQFALLRFGGLESALDQVGVVTTILQWLLLHRAIAAANP